MQIALIGNPENRRVRLFCDAARRFGLPPPQVIPWLDVLQDRADWSARLRGAAVLRIESPGENAEVQRALLAWGATLSDEDSNASRIAPSQLERLTQSQERGRILAPRQWYRGFCAALARIEERWREAAERFGTGPSPVWMQAPRDIARMFDKVACHQALAARGVPVPPALGPVNGFEELLARMAASGRRRVFVKLAHGSSASGVVAFEHARGRMQAFTSAELVCFGDETRLYNSLKVRRYRTHEEIAALIDTLARERVQVEVWIPKASLLGQRFDLRQMVLAGRARHAVVRTGRSPMTNLHLGNTRGDLAALLERMEPEAWRACQETCERAMGAFPESLYAGIDLLIQTDFRRHAILEINAFGDLLPNLLHECLSTYEAEVAALLERAGLPFDAKP